MLQNAARAASPTSAARDDPDGIQFERRRFDPFQHRTLRRRNSQLSLDDCLREMLFVDLLLTSDYQKLHVERVRCPTIRYLLGISYIMRAIEIPLWL